MLRPPVGRDKSDYVAAPKSGLEITLTNLGILGLGGHFGTTVAMSALGQKQTLVRALRMSALPSRADIFGGGVHVR
jgi:hypothetical protein